ncbi:hypothetical protein HD842_001901 [Massilia aurea]|uniref:Uncharacterized protein n=1 Tax=Massilia aurea TaxID=373040 RepID=A0A7W9WZM5_9BURK|nr:hypothetical protein [Massilia aurea]
MGGVACMSADRGALLDVHGKRYNRDDTIQPDEGVPWNMLTC